jgi:hypothetical protein
VCAEEAVDVKHDEAGRCPICGEGRLVDIAYDAGTKTSDGRPTQQPESRQLSSYSCGHEVAGASLASADPEVLDVERRDPTGDVTPSDPAAGAGTSGA